MVRAVDKADAMQTLSSALYYREPFTILVVSPKHGRSYYETLIGSHSLFDLSIRVIFVDCE